MIRTTINITYEVYTRLVEEAEARGIEIEALIIAILQHFSKKYRKEIIIGDAVRYQERKPEGSYVRVHVNWSDNEYEFLIDLRKVHKKSVSRLIAETVMTYLGFPEKLKNP
jgi:predicted CopG family antitoxin